MKIELRKGWIFMDIVEEVLRLEKIDYTYNNKDYVLRDINISFRKGEKVVLLGQNGSGKSTLFSCCNMINLASSGNIYLKGKKIENRKRDINELRRSVGIVFQNPNDQIIASNVYEEISFGPMNLGLEIEEVKERIEKSIEMMNLENYRGRMTQFLSGGEQKRVTIADILAMYPDIILFDEPMSSLDMKSSRELENTINMLAQNGICIVVASHDVDFAWRWADRILVIQDGKIISDTIPEELFKDKNIIEKAELDVPILYSVGEKLNINPIPKKVEDLKEYII